MDTLALRYLDYHTIKFEDVAGKGARQISFNQMQLEEAGRYAAEDADITLRLHRALWPQLEACAPLRSVFEQIEMPLVPVLSRLERTGALVDAKLLQVQSRELGEKLREIEGRAHELAGQPFNLGSPKQLQEILFDKLGLPKVGKTPTGQASTAEPVLQELAENYELPRVILEYRGLSKLKSTYTDRLPEQINPVTGRVHTSYQQAVTATGRLSSTDPNLQNIPVRTAEGRRIRQAFIAPPGQRVLAADYSQIELRIMAHLSGDRGLIDAFANGLDVHRATAAEVFGVEFAAVTDNQRRSAKAINFGLIYGMSAFGLAKQLGVGRAEAQAYIDRYFARYPGVQGYMDRIRRNAAEDGFVETLFGRRLLPARHPRPQPREPPGRRAHRDQRADAGQRRRHHQARDDHRRRLAARQRIPGAHGDAGARRTRVRGCAGRRRGLGRAGEETDVRRRRARRRTRRGRGHRPQLGRGALTLVQCTLPVSRCVPGWHEWFWACAMFPPVPGRLSCSDTP